MNYNMRCFVNLVAIKYCNTVALIFTRGCEKKLELKKKEFLLVIEGTLRDPKKHVNFCFNMQHTKKPTSKGTYLNESVMQHL